ncbi:MAG TPA: lysylphosphatidylglycerol synthase transmembrane domain-containing protein [Acidimicrobiales bacterium]|nr:lysylphosphatidylglycerol synthase transmembrane domain-containing protein [Acidimicrobiales bacterium]
MTRQPPGRRHWITGLVILGIAIGFGFVAFSFTGLVADAWDVLMDMDLAWIGAALACVVVAYCFRAIHMRVVSGTWKAAPVRTALVFFGLGNVLPAAPLEGFAMVRAALRRRRLEAKRIVLLLGFAQWFSVRGILALAAVDALVALSLSHVPRSYVPLAIAASVTTLVVLVATSWLAMRRRFAEVVALVTLRIRHWRDAPLPKVRRARGAAWHAEAMDVVGRRRDRFVLFVTSVAAWTADGLCLYCALRAAGADVGLDVLLLAYTLGILASMVPLLPAGIGVVETVTPLVLHAYGIPFPTALAAVLGFRVLATVLPAAAGTLALAGLRIGQPASTAPA